MYILKFSVNQFFTKLIIKLSLLSTTEIDLIKMVYLQVTNLLTDFKRGCT